MAGGSSAAAPLLLFLSLVATLSPSGRAQSVINVGGGYDAAPLWTAWSTQYAYYDDTATLNFDATLDEPTAFTLFLEYALDLVTVSAVLTSGELEDLGGFVQMPLAGGAIVLAYRLPGIVTPLVLDRETAAGIWMGNVTHWDDPAINATNLGLGLPHEPILLSYFTAEQYGIGQSFAVALSKFSPEFALAYEQSGQNFSNMAPAQEGRATGFSSYTQQHSYVQTMDYSMTYINSAVAAKLGLAYAQMINKAGYTVEARPATITAAMQDAESNMLQANDTVVDISDGPGNNTWPLSYLMFTCLTKADTPYDGCAPITTIFALLTWSELNNQAAISMNALGYSVLTPLLRRILLDTFSGITCFGNSVYYQQVVQGIGSNLIMIPSWMSGYTSGSIYFKYYIATLDEALTQLKEDSVDFALAQGDLTEAQQAEIPDAQTLPLFTYGVAPAYNVPELISVGQMNYTWEIMAGILLGEITMWNHSAIAAVNPGMVGALPPEFIRVIYLTVPSQYTLLWSTALAKAVPSFGTVVHPGSVVNLPDSIINNPLSIPLSSVDSVASTLGSVAYAFTVWDNMQLWPIPTIVYGPMVNSYSISVNCTQPYMLNTIKDFESQLAAVPGVFDLYLPSGPWSWPMLTWGTVVIHTRRTGECSTYTNMLDWLWWTQTNQYADLLALGNAAGVPGTVSVIKRKILTALANTTCDGQPAFSLYSCVYNGTLCSDAGLCSGGTCACFSGYSVKNSSSGLSLSTLLGIILGIFIPSICLVLLFVVLGTFVTLWYQKVSMKKDDWEINPDEVEFGTILGIGGFGEVHKAKWRGTDVAVKVMHSKDITKDMERNFKEEIRVMTALRHPNVVLFMAASTKPPKMCIVMEFMALGSLFDLLHNELLPAIPFQLRCKMAYQAAKGMHFLHSSGIVHRDLKSHNLLLDNKWNVKVSDFGLTKFRQDVKEKAKDGLDHHGTIHWTAPEVLNDDVGLDYMLADVYSFGIILWELHTRNEPYAGMSPAAVAVAVIRDNARPVIPAGAEAIVPEYDDLMRSCWHSDPMIRPSFLESMTRLGSLGHGDGSLTSSFRSTSSSSSAAGSASYNMSSATPTRRTIPGSTSSSSKSGSSSDISDLIIHAGDTGGVRPPQGVVTIVFTDIVRAASLWEFAPSAMRDATVLHNDLLRGLLKEHNGYEVVSHLWDNVNRTNGMGSFCMAFQEPKDALAWCTAVQTELLELKWPAKLLEHPGAAEELANTDDRVVFRGLRVRMGVHLGQPQMTRDPLTRRVQYHGPAVNDTGHLTALTHGGQVVMSRPVYERIRDRPELKDRCCCLGRFVLPDLPNGLRLYEVKIPNLEARFFGGMTGEQTQDDDVDPEPAHDHEMQTTVGDGMEFKEDNFLTSANMCRWIINFGDIQMGEQVGLGSYGVVFRGRWKGVEVAVKRFNKQKLDERTLLDFRAEMAMLSELSHPNIVLFIGACVRVPNLCLVTEFVQRGSLKEILLSNATKLTWRQRLQMLRSAALGVTYLHSLQPSVVHRDLKPSNLLVDEDWNVKVADFGFARIKEENATMTRCGSPCWTAPEIIRGEKYSEKVDMYSFGIIMWEVVTRRQPFAGHNFMSVSLEVLEGRRPQLPADVSKPIRKTIKRSWHADPAKRPSMEELVVFLDGQLADVGGEHV